MDTLHNSVPSLSIMEIKPRQPSSLVLPQQKILPLGFLTHVRITTLLQILPVWHTQNPFLVMISCMLVMVRDLLYLIPHIISCIHQNKYSPCPIYYMFHILKKYYYLFNNCVVKIMSFLNFFSSVFYVKDLITKEVLLSGQSKDGIYVLSESSTTFTPQAFLSTSLPTSADIWHRRLGHLNSLILSLLASNKKVVCTSHHLNFQCQACPLGKSSRLSLGPTGHKTYAPLELIFSNFGALLLCYLLMVFDILSYAFLISLLLFWL